MSDLPPGILGQDTPGVDKEHNVPFTRRTVLTGAAAATTASTVGVVYTLLPKFAARSDPAPADFEDFIQMSAALTGIEASKLKPKVDPIDVKTEYFDWIRARSPAFGDLLAFFRSASYKERFPDSLFEAPQSTTEIGWLARSIILLWYLGAWYDPNELRNLDQQPTPKIISAKAYTQGWIWRVAQTHPMGYSEWAFGYWQDDPPPKEKFV